MLIQLYFLNHIQLQLLIKLKFPKALKYREKLIITDDDNINFYLDVCSCISVM